jgi:hypothetical protein
MFQARGDITFHSLACLSLICILSGYDRPQCHASNAVQNKSKLLPKNRELIQLAVQSTMMVQ